MWRHLLSRVERAQRLVGAMCRLGSQRSSQESAPRCIRDTSEETSQALILWCPTSLWVLGRTSRIRRRRAQDVADTTDSLRAVACIFFVLRRFTTDSLMTTPTPPIPERHLALCRAIGALAKEHGLSQLTTTFTPPFDDEWRDAITMRWESGRHGDASGRVYIESTVRVHTALSENDQAHL